MRQSFRFALLAACLASIVVSAPFIARLQAQASAADALKKAKVLERLAEAWTPPAAPAVAPGFVVDPAWPKPLPHNWIIGDARISATEAGFP